MVPELSVRNYLQAKTFYQDVLGFSLRIERPENQFGYFDLQGAQLMLIEDTSLKHAPVAHWHLQIEVDDIEPLLHRLATAKYPLHKEPYQAWYRAGDIEFGQREFYLRDPDGYLLRFFMANGERAASV